VIVTEPLCVTPPISIVVAEAAFVPMNAINAAAAAAKVPNFFKGFIFFSLDNPARCWALGTQGDLARNQPIFKDP
jgi:hypothetical protein